MSERTDEARQYEHLAREAALAIAPTNAVGELVNVRAHSADIVLMEFASTQEAYRGWNWTVALGWADAETAPTVLETELLPGEDALLAPAWVSWAERFAEYKEEHSDRDTDTSTAESDSETDATEGAEGAEDTKDTDSE